jgi:prepilin-type N-terminal cleavage/methylation domain-containing protein
MVVLTASRRGRAGFTLLEMTLVVLIIGVLMAIAIPAFVSTRERSRTRACVSNMRHIQDAKERWAMEYKMTGAATPSQSDLVPNYVKTYPECPGGGDYTTGTVSESVRCSVGGGHVLD